MREERKEGEEERGRKENQEGEMIETHWWLPGRIYIHMHKMSHVRVMPLEWFPHYIKSVKYNHSWNIFLNKHVSALWHCSRQFSGSQSVINMNAIEYKKNIKKYIIWFYTFLKNNLITEKSTQCLKGSWICWFSIQTAKKGLCRLMSVRCPSLSL